jgi:hypothetical protein
VKNVFLRLCGGFSVMVRPDEDMDLDLESVDCFDTISSGHALMKFMWEGIEVTLYRNGGLIFYHFEDQETAGGYALEIWKRLGLDLK